MSALPYLRGYAPELLAKARQLIDAGTLLGSVLRRYPQAHDVRSDRALFDYVSALKAEHLRNAEPLAKVAYDNHLHVLRNALCMHIEPAYHQLEFDVRLWLTAREVEPAAEA